MARFIGRLALLAAVALSTACGSRSSPSPAATPSCTNGAKDGTETGVDCGGSCGATCGVAVACAAPSDCLFGLCAGGACVAPTTGPAPTGPVTATIDPSAPATLTVVTDERVSVSLELPAGAVAAPVAVTLTPLPASGRSWLRVGVEPAGKLLLAPATVRVELPASTPPSASQDAVLRFTGASDATILPTTAAGTSLSAPARALGLPGFAGGPPSVPVLLGPGPGAARGQALELPSPASILEALPMNLSTRIAIADGLITALRATGRYRDAVEVAALLVQILERWGDPAVQGQLRAFVDRTWSTACAGFGDARTAVQSNMSGGHPFCVAEANRFDRPMLSWVALLMRLEGYTTASCAGYSDGTWADLRQAHVANVIQAERADIQRMWRCDCAETPREEWTPVLAVRCPMLGVSAQPAGSLAAIAPADLPTSDAGWDHVADQVERAYQAADRLAYMGLDVQAGAERAALGEPSLTLARELAYGGCRRDGTAKAVAKLLAVMPGHAGLREDGQYCATSLAAEHRSGTGAILARLGQPLGGRDPGQRGEAGTMGAGKTGSLRLTGPIATLACPVGTALGTEGLEIRVDGVVVQTVDLAPYLSPAIDLDLAAALEAAHPAATAALTSATLTVDRTGDPCDGAWGAHPSPLLTLTLDLLNRRIVFAAAVSGTAGIDWQIHTVNPDGSGAQQIGNGLYPAWSPDRTRIAFVTADPSGGVHVMNADGTGATQVVGGAATKPTWSPDGTRIAYYATTAIRTVKVDGSGAADVASIAEGGEPDWSPDGLQIAFADWGASQEDIFTVGADGGGRTNMTSGAGSGLGAPAWSPDGTRIAHNREGHIWTMGPDGSGAAQLTSGAGEGRATWSRDGTRIAYERYDPVSGTTTICVANADGSGELAVASGVMPDW